jgi:hypothetical protein
MIWLLLPLVAYIVWRFYNKQRIDTQKTTNTVSNVNIKCFGKDSPLYPFINQLEQDADKRLPGETLIKWIKRILPEEKSEKYLTLIKTNNQYRFNPVSDK